MMLLWLMASRERVLRAFPPAVSALLAAAAGYAVYIGGYELFGAVPGVHYARVQLGRNAGGDIAVDATLNTPTVCAALVAAGGLFSLYAGIRILLAAARRRPGAGRHYVIQGMGLALALGAWAAWVLDFLGTAFRGVG